MASDNGAPRDAKELLASSRLFSHLEDADLELLAAHCIREHVDAGAVAISENDPGEALYLVANGRFRVYIGDQPRHEIASGEVFGEIALLSGRPRTSSVVAVRDSELLRLPADDFRRIVADRPAVLREVTGGVIDRLVANERGSECPVPSTSMMVAALEVDDVLFAETVDKFVGALRSFGPTIAVREEDAPDAPARAAWVHRLENAHRFVVFTARDSRSPWYSWAFRQADRTLLVAEGGARPSAQVRSVIADVLAAAPYSSVQLVLLHRASAGWPRGTSAWTHGGAADALAIRHHNVRRGSPSDMARVARLVTGRGYGLVLGGGGPRGFAHLGVMRALDEAGIPVDAVGGTSIGAVMGALRAVDYDDATRRRLAVQRLVNDGGLFAPTLPLLALSSERKVRRLLEATFGGTEVEDCWLPYFSVSASLTRAELVVHDEGSLVTALRASLSLPGILPPVRHGQDLLVDGGLLNNLPIDLMRQRLGGGTVIAVDLGLEVEMHAPAYYEASLPAWRLLVRRLGHPPGAHRMPGLLGVLMRARELPSISSRRELAARYVADMHLRPPVASVTTLDFASAEHLVDLAYDYTVEFLARTEAGRSPG